MSFLLSIQGLMATAFVAGLVLGIVFSEHWRKVGWGVAALAAAFAAIRLATEHGSQLMDLFFAALWAAIGAFPGAALGGWIYRRFRRSA